jgi:hypothetical protein
MRVKLAELPSGVRICNRYVFGGTAPSDGFGLNLAAGLAASDVVEVMSLIDGYRFGNLRVTDLSARLELQRGARQAYMRKLRLPRRISPGQRRVRAKLDVVHVGGRRETLTQTIRLPRGIRRGVHELTLTGTDADDGAGDIFGSIMTLIIGDEEEDQGGDPGPRSIKALARSIRAIQRYDGVHVKLDGRRGRGARAFRRDDLRLSGQVGASVRVR